jgi:hypothetical protein
MDGNRVGEAVITSGVCPYCSGSGIQQGTAELDGELVVVLRVCKHCDKASHKPVKKDEVIYD